ncbi:hypothetical protein DQ04_08761010 [Trypanosoma grayi]|uniref:hypothetical protein n=1 Tax=Trypanosoma grayi TaxID=71804 RepID=UPI0004F46299|nr:hypothetical protein DQ04_08761010 [Trypanosoma grayi]KEG07811.1 hypothetical protein DQ04_08761010 [Trypanosoma grayi]
MDTLDTHTALGFPNVSDNGVTCAGCTQRWGAPATSLFTWRRCVCCRAPAERTSCRCGDPSWGLSLLAHVLLTYWRVIRTVTVLLSDRHAPAQHCATLYWLLFSTSPPPFSGSPSQFVFVLLSPRLMIAEGDVWSVATGG